ncbi:unnamed protein product [Litomosoides sigmodontis]|uniref:EGF-like domain-containing protein n=1 Tax=Litomosoides sigmodontis TaxID=42156 RepID=A0A3P6TIT2_LITSI|nr:unnamed protein product [Litomosoides sigmodontis]
MIAVKDPIRNAKVDATSTVYAVVQIGLRGGIFQYTNALKILGKPSEVLIFDEAFFCYRGATLIDQDKCSKDDLPILCRPGHYHSLISKKCEVCPQGHYQFRAGRPRCHKCPQGYTTLTTKSIYPTSCFGSTNWLPNLPDTVTRHVYLVFIDQRIANCPPGMEYSSNGSCVPCKRGFFKKPNDIVCQPCDPAHTTESVGSLTELSCTLPLCKQGYYLNRQLMQCLNCSNGYYQDEVGGDFCKRCPIGTTTTIPGATSIDSCISTNQCKNGEHRCHSLAVCVDLPDKDDKPTYSCRCQPGFVGNGFTCTGLFDVNLPLFQYVTIEVGEVRRKYICLNLCYNNAECVKTAHGKPRCICPPGYHGLRCETKK